jgi:anti-sigma B factor antagonist
MIAQECQVILFKPQGSIDLEGGKALSEQMATVKPQRDQLWIIDLAEVDLMNSSGLIPLVKGLKIARQSGCRLVICNCSASVRLILELTQLDSVFEIFDTYQDIFTIVKDTRLVVIG